MAQQKSFWVLIILFFNTTLLWSNVKANDIEFTKTKIRFGKIILNVKVAKTTIQQERGLMFVKNMPANEGMLFVYDVEDIRGFWMKNTLIPLSIGFFGADQKLFQIENMRPVKSFLDQNIDRSHSQKPAQYALEVNQGWFKKNKIALGTKFEWVKKSKEN